METRLTVRAYMKCGSESDKNVLIGWECRNSAQFGPQNPCPEPSGELKWNKARSLCLNWVVVQGNEISSSDLAIKSFTG